MASVYNYNCLFKSKGGHAVGLPVTPRSSPPAPLAAVVPWAPPPRLRRPCGALGAPAPSQPSASENAVDGPQWPQVDMLG